MANLPASTGLATNSASLDALRQSAARDPKAAIKETSRQLESLFMNELMKSMRSTTMSSGLFDNSGTEMGTQMLDQQYANQLSGLPGGLADLIARQLEKQMGVASSAVPLVPGKLPATDAAASATKPRIPQKAYAEDFVRRHTPAADAAAADTGIPASFIGIIFTGALLIEIIFSLDGLGLLGYEAAINRDYQVVFAITYVFSLIGLVVNLIGDIIYMLVDPRIDFEARET